MWFCCVVTRHKLFDIVCFKHVWNYTNNWVRAVTLLFIFTLLQCYVVKTLTCADFSGYSGHGLLVWLSSVRGSSPPAARFLFVVCAHCASVGFRWFGVLLVTSVSLTTCNSQQSIIYLTVHHTLTKFKGLVTGENVTGNKSSKLILPFRQFI